ncbi:MAG TPA: polyprenol monophosphomannose synthase [Tepidisphaeraceae bacterium]|nr:polyprenol monophosphomannose synthase [Tepidisphaeraceae bacterium]
MVSPASTEIDVSVVVPTLNEAGNLATLIGRIDAELRGRPYEILLIDDSSTDGTADLVRRLSAMNPVRLIERESPTGGLSGAVILGLSEARGQFLVVMDADLQHPPEQIPDLLAPLESNEAEFVLGSRYVRGASTDGRWGALRKLNSWAATLLARPFAGRARDPMSGFFALRRQTFQRAKRLNPIGYKIALELMCKCQVASVREVPIHFGLRTAGESKLNLSQQLRYLDHLSRLYDFCFPRGSAWVKFAIATACAWLAAFSVYVRLVAHDVSPVLAPTLAFAGAGLTTAVFHLRALRRAGKPLASRRDWIDFALVTIGEWSICTLAARWLGTHIEHLTVLQFFAVVFSAVAAARLALRTRMLHSLQGVRLAQSAPPARTIREAA